MVSQFSMTKLSGENNLKTRTIAEKIMVIMKSHIGSFNGITGRALFKQVYGILPENTPVDLFRWLKIKEAMHYLRLYSKCFIVFDSSERDCYLFYVPETNNDIQDYVNLLETNIKQMHKMKDRARESVRNNWSKLDWEIERPKIKKMR